MNEENIPIDIHYNKLLGKLRDKNYENKELFVWSSDYYNSSDVLLQIGSSADITVFNNGRLLL